MEPNENASTMGQDPNKPGSGSAHAGSQSGSSAASHSAPKRKRAPVKKKAASSNANAQRSASAPAPKQKRQKVDVLAEWTGLVASEKTAQRMLDKIHTKMDRMRDRARKLMGNLFDTPTAKGGRRKAASSRRAASSVKGKGFRVNHDGTKSMALQIAEELDAIGVGGISEESLRSKLPEGTLAKLTINKMIRAGDVEKQATANGDRLVLSQSGKDKLTVSNAKLAAHSGGTANGSATDTRNAATSASGF